MRRSCPLVVSAFLLSAAVALADVPPPAGAKYVDPRVRFVGIEKLGSYVFFLHYETGNDALHMGSVSVAVKNNDAFTLRNTGRFLSRMRLLALTLADFDKLKNAKPPRPSIDEKAHGVFTASFPPPTNTVSSFAFKAPLTEYRVTLDKGKLDVQAPAKLHSEAAPAGPLPMWAFFTVFALAGLWFAQAPISASRTNGFGQSEPEA